MLKSFQKRVSARKIKLIKGLCLSIITLLFSLCTTPFQIYANTVGGDSPIIGVNISILDYEFDVEPVSYNVQLSTDQTRWQCMSSHSTMGCQVWQSQSTSDVVQHTISGAIGASNSTTYGRVYQYDFVFDKSYVGSVTFSQGLTGTYYVNGDHLILNSETLVGTFSVSSYSLTYAPEETITRLRQFNFPVESLSFVYGLLHRSDIDYVDIRNLYSWFYPMFNIHQNQYLYETWINSGDSLYIIIVVNRNIYNDSLWNQYFRLKNISDNSTVSVASVETLSRPFGEYQYNLLKVRYDVSTSQNYRLFYVGQSDLEIVPIFCNRSSNMGNLSTDFALTYGFDNRLLNDIHKIAQGTTESNSAATGLDSETSSFESVASGLYTSENSFNQNMNSSLQSIDTSFDPSTSFGSKFLYSADWVRSQFNTITSNTPFGSVLSFSMLLGLSLLIIGKVFK